MSWITITILVVVGLVVFVLISAMISGMTSASKYRNMGRGIFEGKITTGNQPNATELPDLSEVAAEMRRQMNDPNYFGKRLGDDSPASQGEGPVPHQDEPSSVYRPEHNCGYSECPHGGYHHPMCPYYRKHFTQ